MGQIIVESMSDELAKAIKQISEAMQKIESSGLKKKTIVILLKDYLGNTVRKDQIESVINGLNALERTYLDEQGK